ncbi:zf-BED domain-containing protein/DUF659 domain-containing protein/Dimer_Tnp_hAT domain-containing protein [Cephalotus follicularis]|uniref:Zf-BED domain-containing protein/DUF659 domain-containing protein/Dimer_Tnp_hAT domain-containing protein n=1 Tax=Cephalotus follicularis TaxID=3775 RepID=A0A1Q3CHV9_CEPFO|nr:zf-BED domain-containing protein/DUF659 domain-containing protein/Dimer_Tnp_hAT domain-containing protein [Cephalotus follicularis]
MELNLEPMPITSQRQDLAWKHCQVFKNGSRAQIKCLYCSKMFKGGGIHRFKEHLAGRKGQGPICGHVPQHVRQLMQQSLDRILGKQKNRPQKMTHQQKLHGEVTNVSTPPLTLIDIFVNECDANTGFKSVGILDLFDPSSDLLTNQEEGTSNINADGRNRLSSKYYSSNANDADIIDSMALASHKVDNPVHMAIGRFLYDIGADLNAGNSVYFQPMIDAITSGGPGVVAPSCHDLQGWMLKDSLKEVKNDIDECKALWGRTGCSLLVDHWNSENGKILINFLVYSPQGIIFLKSVDEIHTMYSADDLYELLKQVVEEVGVGCVLQVITHSEENYIVAGKRLMDTFPSLYWAPCAVHCIDSILEDFSKLVWINEIIKQARCITRFVYNNSVVLNMMRRFTFGHEIVQQGVTRSAANFMTLKQMAHLKLNLQAMVTSEEWMHCPYSKKPGGLTMLDIVSNRSFWSSCILIIRLINPLLSVMRIVSSKKRPAMGYIYAGLYRAKETIKRELVKREEYVVYWNVIDHWWKQQWQSPLHAAGFFLNPKCFYSIEGDMHNEIMSRMFDCIERLVPDIEVQDKIVKEITLYKNAVGDLGRKMAIRARDTLLPVEWWSAYGGGCPNLARLAVRILNQTCSSVGCRWNQIPFKRMHDTKNRLERRRLNDLVFLQYNLHLKQIKEQISTDPISSDSRSSLEDWVMENEVGSEDHGSSDWISLDQLHANTMLLGPGDDAEICGAGFDDFDIFNGLKEVKEENV